MESVPVMSNSDFAKTFNKLNLSYKVIYKIDFKTEFSLNLFYILKATLLVLYFFTFLEPIESTYQPEANLESISSYSFLIFNLFNEFFK